MLTIRSFIHFGNTISSRQCRCTARRLYGSYGSVDGFQQAQTESGENRLYEVRDTPAPASAVHRSTDVRQRDNPAIQYSA